MRNTDEIMKELSKNWPDICWAFSSDFDAMWDALIIRGTTLDYKHTRDWCISLGPLAYKIGDRGITTACAGAMSCIEDQLRTFSPKVRRFSWYKRAK